MVTLNRIYTRSGDAGITSLGNGERRPKFDPRVTAYGSIDETNAAIGLARTFAQGAYPDLDLKLRQIQNDLFDLGADLCTPAAEPQKTQLRILPSQVSRLERDMDELNRDLPPLSSFVLPGGSQAAAGLHVARTICRRAERHIVRLSTTSGEYVNPDAIKFVNRLSDFLFVAARWANAQGSLDVLWSPGANR